MVQRQQSGDAEVDTAQKDHIAQVLRGTSTENGQYPKIVAIVDDHRNVMRDNHQRSADLSAHQIDDVLVQLLAIALPLRARQWALLGPSLGRRDVEGRNKARQRCGDDT